MKEGKVKHLGVANFSLSQVEKLLQTASVKPVVNQVELHPYLSQRKLVGTCRRKVYTILPLCPAFVPLSSLLKRCIEKLCLMLWASWHYEVSAGLNFSSINSNF